MLDEYNDELPDDFNCTIQELKQFIELQEDFKLEEFQLHHTGIKTLLNHSNAYVCFYFNCTIQELKQPEQLRCHKPPR